MIAIRTESTKLAIKIVDTWSNMWEVFMELPEDVVQLFIARAFAGGYKDRGWQIFDWQDYEGVPNSIIMDLGKDFNYGMVGLCTGDEDGRCGITYRMFARGVITDPLDELDYTVCKGMGVDDYLEVANLFKSIIT